MEQQSHNSNIDLRSSDDMLQSKDKKKRRSSKSNPNISQIEEGANTDLPINLDRNSLNTEEPFKANL